MARFDYVMNVRDTQPKACTQEVFEGILDREDVARVCSQIAGLEAQMDIATALTDEADRRATLARLHDEVAALKRGLPAFTFFASFQGKARRTENAVASGLAYLDLDHVENARSLWASIEMTVSEEVLARVPLVHVTPSGRGLRIVFFLRPGDTGIEAAQAQMAAELGIHDYDAVCKDAARLSFAVPRNYVLKYDATLWEGLTPDPSPVGEGRGKGVEEEREKGSHLGDTSGHQTHHTHPLSQLPSPTGEERGKGVGEEKKKGVEEEWEQGSHAGDTALAEEATTGDTSGHQTQRTQPLSQLPSPMGEGRGKGVGEEWKKGSHLGDTSGHQTHHTQPLSQLPSPTGEGSGVRPSGVRPWVRPFKGIPYTSIISSWWRRTGGEPAEGERNVKLHKLAVNLRAICDNRKDVLMQVMPRFGLSEAELRSIIDSACKEPPKGISKMIKQIVDELLPLSSSEDDTIPESFDDMDVEGMSQNNNSPLGVLKGGARSLPIGLKESLIGVPPAMHMPVLCSVLPLAATYADGVEVEYCDGQRQHLGLMSIIRGEQASGKSVCKNAVDVWKRQFDNEDALARRREEEWKERKKARKANEKAPEDPHVLIRMLPVTVSCSTLLKRFKNANGHTLYSFGEELDTLRKTNGAGSWSSKYDIYRLSFDRGEWGQDYNSDQAESGVVRVAYNWTMLGTDGALRKCFKSDNIENGLSSRVLVAEMPDSSFTKMPKFGRRSTEDEARIQEAVTRLRSYSGFIDTPRLRKAIEQWVEQKRVEAAKDIDHVKDVYRKRAAVIGFRCGVIHFLLSQESEKIKMNNGKCREAKGSVDFALMMADYCLQQQMAAFGETLQSQFVEARDDCQRYGSNHSVFDQLAPSFTLDDLRALKRGFCSESSLRKIISRWYRDHWIEKTDKSRWKKVESGN